MKLTRENTRFIDTYLDNSNVVYADIRIEMTDHVASEIEDIMQSGDNRDFYYVFKDYMVENKSRLLQNNKRFLKIADRKIAKALFKDMLTFRSLFLFIIALFILFAARDYLDFKSFKNILFGIPFFLLIAFGGYYWVALKRYKMDRFSVVERISFPFIVIYHIFSFIMNTSRSNLETQNTIYLIIIVSLALTITLSLFNITHKLTKEYHQKFKALNII